MAEPRRDEQARRFSALVAGRLAQNRWTLAAGAVAVLVLHYVGGGSWAFTVAVILLLVAVTALAPRRTRGQRKADRAAAADRSGLDGLTAQSLA